MTIVGFICLGPKRRPQGKAISTYGLVGLRPG